MDKTERETQDFMNVESFSQLPFIRPAPKEKPNIRLFGIEFGDGTTDDSNSADTINNKAFHELDSTNNNNTGESNRKFECHYCCRNFPTSQALGGHQNAHKRERQHAKRQHLQIQSAAAMVHTSNTGSLSDVYGFMNYRFSSSSAPTMPNYPTWNANLHNITTNNSSSSSRSIYGTHTYHSYSHLQQQPINGSPLALWRIPTCTNRNDNNAPTTFNRERSSLHPLPLFGGGGEEMMMNGRASQVIGPSAASQNRYVVYDFKTSVNDHLSLDLHL